MNPGTKKTQQDLVKLQFALAADDWTIQIVPEDDQGRPIREVVTRKKLFSTEQVSWFRYKNAHGCHVYGRPNSTRYILIDDVEQAGIVRLKQDGLAPTAIIETSPDNYQIWITASNDELPVPVTTQLAKLLEQRYSTDTGSADALHLGRLPGLRNKKAKYRTEHNQGGPLVLLRRARDVPNIPDGIGALIEEAERIAADRLTPSSPSASGACVLTITTIDIYPSRSRMTQEDAREIYEAELEHQAKRKGWNLPIGKGFRSEADYAVAYSLRVQYGYDADDIAALLMHASEKAAERGMEYVIKTVNAAL